jgi:hypothetical protein
MGHRGIVLGELDLIPSSNNFCCLIEGKVYPVHAIKMHRWSRGIAPLILALGTWKIGEWLASCSSRFAAGKEPQ